MASSDVFAEHDTEAAAWARLSAGMRNGLVSIAAVRLLLSGFRSAISKPTVRLGFADYVFKLSCNHHQVSTKISTSDKFGRRNHASDRRFAESRALGGS